MNEEFDSSDSSDEEYVPSDGEVGSEEEGSGEEEDIEALVKDEEENGSQVKLKGKKRKAKPTTFARKRKGGIKLEGEEIVKNEEDEYNKELAENIQKEQEQKKVEEEKKKADSLWADFMKDVGSPKTKPKSTSSLGSLSSIPTHSKPSSSISKSTTVKTFTGLNKTNGADKSKVKITKQYDFAGETVTVTKEVDANSKEAKLELQKSEEEKRKEVRPAIPGIRKPGGLGSVLGKIGNKPKMGTLEKSKLDWDSFKQKEGIEEELQIHNRGKEGYVERQKFLERADLRQFEIEKNLRLGNSKKGFFSTE